MRHQPTACLTALRFLLVSSAVACADAPTRPAALPFGSGLPVVRVDLASDVGAPRARDVMALSAAVGAGAVMVAGPVDLGSLGGGHSQASDVNDAGSVVGSSITAGRDLHAFHWTAERGMLDLGTLGGIGSAAYGINTAGWVVGASSTAGGDWHAFLWTPADGMRDLGTLGGSDSEAADLNDAGTVVGASETPDGHHRAFLWTADAGMRDLGALPLGDESSAAAINNAGQVVGESFFHPVLWTAEGVIQDLGTLHGCCGAAVDINDSGNVAGSVRGRSNGAPTYDDGAFLWAPASGMQDLAIVRHGGFGSGGPVSASARGINDAGQVVGWVRGPGERAFFWDLGTGAVWLPPLPGEAEAAAFALNNLGRVVGRSGGHAVAWTLQPAGAGAPLVDRLQAGVLGPGVYPAFAPAGGVWLRVRLTDPDDEAGTEVRWRWEIDWGDGVVHTPDVGHKGEFVFLRPTLYTTSGPHTISVRATDPGGTTGPIAMTTAP